MQARGQLAELLPPQYIHAPCQGTPVCKELRHFPGAVQTHPPTAARSKHARAQDFRNQLQAGMVGAGAHLAAVMMAEVTVRMYPGRPDQMSLIA